MRNRNRRKQRRERKRKCEIFIETETGADGKNGKIERNRLSERQRHNHTDRKTDSFIKLAIIMFSAINRHMDKKKLDEKDGEEKERERQRQTDRQTEKS